jgi:hypothetical protein
VRRADAVAVGVPFSPGLRPPRPRLGKLGGTSSPVGSISTGANGEPNNWASAEVSQRPSSSGELARRAGLPQKWHFVDLGDPFDQRERSGLRRRRRFSRRARFVGQCSITGPSTVRCARRRAPPRITAEPSCLRCAIFRRHVGSRAEVHRRLNPPRRGALERNVSRLTKQAPGDYAYRGCGNERRTLQALKKVPLDCAG